MKKYPTSSITVRRMDFDFKNIPRYWINNSPFFTHILNSLSSTFPVGERFFVDSVRAFQDGLSDPKLKAEVRAFIGQEAMHAKEHEHFNAAIKAMGIDISFSENLVTKRMSFLKANTSKERQLAMTCALEHFTAILSEMVLTDPEFYNMVDPSVRHLWVWHAIEENEHKGVAFDVYQDQVNNYALRIQVMMLVTLFFMFNQTFFMARLVYRDKKHLDWKMWATGINQLWGNPGWFRKLIPSYLAYYRKDFHPWQHDTRALLEKWKADLDIDKHATVRRVSSS